MNAEGADPLQGAYDRWRDALADHRQGATTRLAFLDATDALARALADNHRNWRNAYSGTRGNSRSDP